MEPRCYTCREENVEAQVDDFELVVLEDAAEDIHKDFRSRLKYARLWGSGKHDGVMVKRDHVLQDGDIIELHV